MSWKDKLKMIALGLTTAAATTSCVGAGEEMSITKSDTQQEPTEVVPECKEMKETFPEEYKEHREKLANFNRAERSDDDRLPSDEIIELRKQLKQAKVPLVKGDSVLVSFTRVNKGTEENPQYEFSDLEYIHKGKPQAILTKEINDDDPSIEKYKFSTYDSKDYSLDENTADIRMIVSDYEGGVEMVHVNSVEESREAIEKHKKEYYDSKAKALAKDVKELSKDELGKKIRDTFYLNYVKGSKKP